MLYIDLDISREHGEQIASWQGSWFTGSGLFPIPITGHNTPQKHEGGVAHFFEMKSSHAVFYSSIPIHPFPKQPHHH